MFLPLLKEERLALAKVHSQVLQNVVDRLDKAFQFVLNRALTMHGCITPLYQGLLRKSMQ